LEATVIPTALQSQEHLAQRRLVELCSLDSGSGREAQLLPALRPMLEQLGATVEIHELAPGRCNVLATWGEPRVLFSTHLDTVPPFLPVRVKDGSVFARGACDAKGQIVAQILAIQQLLTEGHQGFAWLGVAGEETDSLGAREALRWKDRFRRCRVLVNGEPTELKLATGQRGVDHLCLRCHGKAAHSGSPQLGHSASLDLLDWLQALRRLPLKEDAHLGPEVWNLGLLRGGNAVNVIPSEAEADISVRTLPGSTFRVDAERHRPRGGELQVRLSEPPDRYPEIPGFEQAPMPFGSDAPQLRELIPDRTVVLAGPGSIRVAHTDDEHLRLADVMAGIALNRRLALHFLEKP
jgi:acetylornithine deacetylase